ncbi:sensor histidine kinase [Marinimicrobium sp. ARAG 43.8]|uniref:sensor histidine kinase n=1 Tax=Marinimicrobium sp. ARAG 43.8 TaxID=3418719 RepID=UPI003CF6CFAF
MTVNDRPPELYLQWVRWLLAAALSLVIGAEALIGNTSPQQGWLVLWCAVWLVQLLSYVPWPRVDHHRLAVHLLLDILLWNGVVWLTGGATNPFAALLLIPLVLAFLLLPPRWAAGLLLVSITGQLVQLVAIPDMHAGAHGMDRHFEAMVIGFVIAAVLMAVTLLYLRRQLHQRDQDIQQLREAQLRDEQLLAVGTAAAQLTHEMATPVQSVRLLMDEMEVGLNESSRAATEIEREMIRQQLDRMQSLLSDWRLIAEDVRERRLQPLSVKALLQSVRDLLLITRPGEQVMWAVQSALGDIQVRADRTLIPAILSLLHNALDADGQVKAKSHINGDVWQLVIDNDGRSLAPELQARLGAEFVASDTGFGVGALVSYATLERFGGRVYWSGDERGTRTLLELPIDKSA